MAKSSINFAKGSSHSFQHNDRSEEIEPHYLLPVEHRLENECNRSAVEAQKMFDDLFENAKEKYQEKFGQKFQGKKENANWEALINLNKEHTIKDVERLVREIEKETGFKAVQISIHRDEGRINEKTGHPIYNLHAHVNFFTLDPETGRQQFRLSVSKSDRERIRKEHGLKPDEKIPRELVAVIDKNKLSKLQDITARELGMERGEKGSEKVRLGHKQYRATEQEKEKLLEKIEELQKENAELKYNFRDMQKQITALDAPSEDKKELHRLNTEINKMKIEGATKDLKISELEAKIKEGQSLSEKYATLPFKERMAMRSEMRAIVGDGDGVELESVKKHLELSQGEIKSLKVQLQEAIKVPNTDERNALAQKLQKENAIDEIAKSCYKKVEEKNFFTTETKTVFDTKTFVEKIKERERDHQKLHSFNDRIIVTVVDKMKTIVEMSKTALEAIKSKITGKSIGEVQKEREELNLSNTDKIRGFVDQLKEQEKLNLSNTDKIRGFVDQLKLKESEKPKSRGMER